MRSPRRSRSPFRERAALRLAQTTPAPYADGPIPVHRVSTGGELLALDDVTLAVADPASMSTFLCDHVGMGRLSVDADTTVLGACAGAATITLIAAGGPREPGALARLVLRVADVARAAAMLPAGTQIEGDLLERAAFRGPEGLGLGFTLVAGGGIDYDLDHVDLRCEDPAQTATALAEAGFATRGHALHVADRYVTLAASSGLPAQRPLLHHIAVSVDSTDAVVAMAHERDLEVRAGLPRDTVGIVMPGRERIGLHFARR
jgi:catechol 2,3-dioxygenase-like lactoylglutathione lyase family enzyme